MATNQKRSAGGPASTLLTPDNCALLMIDFQPTSFFTTQSIDRQLLIDNILGLAETARLFAVPTILTTVVKDSFSGPQLTELSEVFPDTEPIDRTGNNPWEDERVTSAVSRTGRKKLVMAGLWTSNCVALPALSAREHGYESYVVADACGDVSVSAHEMGLMRMVQAQVIPITWQAFMLELQRDWTRDTATQVNEIAKRHGGAEGQAARYAEAMLADR